MSELITISNQKISNQKIDTVNARDLHEFLGVRRDFTTWIKARIKQYYFVENRDFTLIHPNGGIKGKGGDRRSKEYHLTLDMAKELSMVERTDRGREARQYFIECERIAKAKPVNPSASPKRQPIHPVNTDVLFKRSYDGITEIETTPAELETLQKYFSEKELELICILRSLNSERRSNAYKNVHMTYKVMHRVRQQMSHRPDLSEREAIRHLINKRIGLT
ncbi:MAG: phage antirepressor Ant [Desulfobacteraceae bacterium]|nr:phage antirepressor Ant [Desulfobacteraceae bacterium]